MLAGRILDVALGGGVVGRDCRETLENRAQPLLQWRVLGVQQQGEWLGYIIGRWIHSQSRYSVRDQISDSS